VNTPIRLVVVDDHALFRRGLIALLSEMTEFEVVGEAGGGNEAVQVVAQQKPDVVLLDINMPEMDGLETLEAFHRSHLGGRVLMLTISQNEEDLVKAIMAGASGYLLKNAEPEALRSTIRQVAAGNSVLSSEMTAKAFGLLRREQLSRHHNLLSEREIEVLRCLGHGLTTARIATELFISENTVKTHIRHILEKMMVHNRTEAVAKGVQMGLIS
jgi:two-component system nitrate/nitrite response regulator NarL